MPHSTQVLAYGTVSQFNMAELRKGLAALGYSSRAVLFDKSKYELVPTPAILYMRPERLEVEGNIGHFVVLKSVTASTAVIIGFSPTVDAVEISLRDLGKIWDGECILVSPRGKWHSVSAILQIGVAMLTTAGLVLAISICLRRTSPEGRQIAASCIMAVTLLGCADANVECPLRFSTKDVDIGEVSAGETVACAFPFTVHGDNPVTIQSVSSSCDCVSLSEDLFGVSLASGTSGNVRALMETRGRTGRVRGTMLVTTNDSRASTITLTVTANVVPQINLMTSIPIRVNTLVAEHQTVTVQAELRRSVSEGPSLWLPEQSDVAGFEVEAFETQLQAIPPAGAMREDVVREVFLWRLKTPLYSESGTHKFNLALHLEGKRKYEIGVPVILNTQTRISGAIDRIYFGLLTPGVPKSIEVPVRCHNGVDLRDFEIKCDLECVTCERSSEKGTIRVTVVPPNTLGRLDGVLSIAKAESASIELTIPVSGIVGGAAE